MANLLAKAKRLLRGGYMRNMPVWSEIWRDEVPFFTENKTKLFPEDEYIDKIHQKFPRLRKMAPKRLLVISVILRLFIVYSFG